MKKYTPLFNPENLPISFVCKDCGTELKFDEGKLKKIPELISDRIGGRLKFKQEITAICVKCNKEYENYFDN